jgi:hypothetical protein
MANSTMFPDYTVLAAEMLKQMDKDERSASSDKDLLLSVHQVIETFSTIVTEFQKLKATLPLTVQAETFEGQMLISMFIPLERAAFVAAGVLRNTYINPQGTDTITLRDDAVAAFKHAIGHASYIGQNAALDILRAVDENIATNNVETTYSTPLKEMIHQLRLSVDPNFDANTAMAPDAEDLELQAASRFIITGIATPDKPVQSAPGVLPKPLAQPANKSLSPLGTVQAYIYEALAVMRQIDEQAKRKTDPDPIAAAKFALAAYKKSMGRFEHEKANAPALAAQEGAVKRAWLRPLTHAFHTMQNTYFYAAPNNPKLHELLVVTEVVLNEIIIRVADIDKKVAFDLARHLELMANLSRVKDKDILPIVSRLRESIVPVLLDTAKHGQVVVPLRPAKNDNKKDGGENGGTPPGTNLN